VQSARQAPQRRAFGAHSAEAAAEEMNKWKKIFVSSVSNSLFRSK